VRIFRKLAQLLDVDLVTNAPADGDSLTYDSASSKWVPGAGGGGGGGAPSDVDYLIGTASGDLSAEIVVGTAPGGELGGTWASPTVDATHSGSSHASVQAAAEATAAAALSTHASDTTGIHGIADTSALETSAGAQSKVDTHSADTTSVHGITDTSALALTANVPSNATFNDHSARHENGGADEISIAGLDGTPTELTNHLNDTSDAHDASAISVLDTAANFTGTDVEAVLAELQDNIDAGGGGSVDPEDMNLIVAMEVFA